MQLGPKTFILGGVAGILALGLVFSLSPRHAPPLVHVPSEELIGRSGGDDVVHALQDIVETWADPSVFDEAEDAQTTRIALEAEAKALLSRLETSSISPLGQLRLRQAWDVAETPAAQTEVLLELRSALSN